MSSEIHINAFAMNCPGHLSPGLWTHPRDRSAHYNTLEYWTDLAKLLESGLIDGLFLADVLGLYDVYGGGPETALRNATQVPVNDALLVIPAMAAVTTHLCFASTAVLSFEPPYTFARRMSTLDHLTRGRIGWNIVTGYLDSAARGAGHERQVSHDIRYDIAHDYMDAVYKLWEGSWDDAAIVKDTARGIYADPNHVRPALHKGPYYQLNAIHLSEPSPQRTPLLFQAGSSNKGRAFAAKHAECVFLNGRSKALVASRVTDIRRRAAAAGRRASSVKAFVELNVIVAKTEAAARAKYDEYLSYGSIEGALALLSGWLGIDLKAHGLDRPLEYVENDAIRSAIEALTVENPDKRVWTARDLARSTIVGGSTTSLVGTPETIADNLQEWVRDTGVDGFNISYAVMPETFVDFVELVVPELQRRGVFKKEYSEGTFREKLFGRGHARLKPPHPAAGFRYQPFTA
ncbi:LLM class flavin-dependent oxidoreductase [Labrys sp. KNU-23]|uniref:LLM class flavin-dependent oxidoreductase n=1 Tax=Labrys sp. KNU-23 TaxID=2789216 RepID=UPI0011EE7352|nr:LLM class flavin-dependent oxidoreductase [Labrys sp. KNU-23]QEN84875.1 LLM class flavin-dependent oxidoreductase [Labrys sp. KNU-23]